MPLIKRDNTSALILTEILPEPSKRRNALNQAGQYKKFKDFLYRKLESLSRNALNQAGQYKCQDILA